MIFMPQSYKHSFWQLCDVTDQLRKIRYMTISAHLASTTNVTLVMLYRIAISILMRYRYDI